MAPALVLLIGSGLTFIVAANRSSALARERQLRFEAEAAELEQQVEAAANRTVEEFRAGVNFLTVTHPGPLDQYQQFFNRQLVQLVAEDPGVVMVEELPSSEFDELVARERALGHDDFTVTTFPVPGEPRLVMTRATRETVGAVPLIGLDVTVIRDVIFPRGIDPGDVQLTLLTPEQVRLLGPIGFTGAAGAELPEITVLLVASIPDIDGNFLGYAVMFESLDDYLSNVDGGELNIELWAAGLDLPVAQRLTADAIPLDDAELVDRYALTTASFGWEAVVWANDDYEPVAGVLNQRAIWGVGLGVSVAAFGFGIWRDRTRRRLDRTEGELALVRELAITDPLTGLLNRAGLIDAARSYDPWLPAALFFVDLDGFKSVNDTLGHQYGDDVLRAVADRLQEIFRTDDLVARLGGDEYVVCTFGPIETGHLERLSARITDQVSLIDARISSSVGVSMRAAGSGTDIKELLRQADEAMYEAKRAGGHTYRLRG